MEFEDLLSTFLVRLKSRNYTQATIYGYGSDIKRFKGYMESRYNLPWSVASTTSRDIDAYLGHLVETEGLSEVTANRHLNCLRSFFKSMVVLDEVRVNPATSVMPNRTDFKEMYFVTEDTVLMLAEGVQDLLMKTILLSLFYTGVRLFELIEATIAQVDLSSKMLYVLGKGRKNRSIPIHVEHLFPVLVEYSEEFLNGKNKYEPYFQLQRTGEISQATVVKRFHELSEAMCITPHVTPRVLRHSFATHYLRTGGKLDELMKLMGHDNMATTGRYLHPGLNEVTIGINRM